MKIYNKLVRDLIPKVIEQNGKKFVIHIAGKDENVKLLKEKLMEEVNEYLEAGNLEELADIMEVLVGLAEKIGYSEEELFRKRVAKKKERGGFSSGVVLEKVFE